MKKLFLFCICVIGIALPARAANPSFGSFNTNDFIVAPPFISLSHTHTGGTNVFNFTTNVFENSTIYITNSFLVISNTVVTINGTNVSALNPTIGRIPYNQDGTNFGDSPLYYIDTSTVGADQVFTGDIGVTNLATGGFVISIDSGLGYGILSNAPFSSFALWTNISGTYFATDPTMTSLEVTNILSDQTLAVFGSLRVISNLFTNVVAGENDLDVFNVGSVALISSDPTAEIRLNTGNGTGSFLLLSLVNDANPLVLKNGQALTDAPFFYTYLSGGDWQPSHIGETLLLYANGNGWAEVGRFGGPTNVVTQEFWQLAGGYLQPVDLTQPFFWTNYVQWGSDSKLYRSGNDLAYTNATEAFFRSQTSAGNDVVVGADSVGRAILGTAGHFVGIYNQNGSGTGGYVFLNDKDFAPNWGDMSLGRPASAGGNLWSNVNSRVDYVWGYDNVISGNYSRLAMSHTGTNGAIVFDSQSSGSAGSPVGFWIGNTTNHLSIPYDDFRVKLRGDFKDTASAWANGASIQFNKANTYTSGNPATYQSSWILSVIDNQSEFANAIGQKDQVEMLGSTALVGVNPMTVNGGSGLGEGLWLWNSHGGSLGVANNSPALVLYGRAWNPLTSAEQLSGFGTWAEIRETTNTPQADQWTTYTANGSSTNVFGVTGGGQIVLPLAHTPASSSETNYVGAIAWDASFIYVWTATNVNKRVALSTW